jgi:DNA-binding beta-propeller fold protein YncE
MRKPCNVRLGLLTTLAAIVCATSSPAALCGDASGDGFLGPSDALRALRIAVAGGYDRRGDVFPRDSGAGAGDGGAGAGDGGAGAGDGKIGASDALQILRSSVSSSIPPCFGADERLAVVTTAPYEFYSSAGVAVVDVATRAFAYNGGELDGDAVIRTPNGVPVVVNRHNFNSLQIVDTASEDLGTVKACSIEDGFNSNPQDVVLVSESKGYVTPYAGDSLFIISPPVLFEPANDPACNSIVSGHVDLSSFDSDGVPQMDQMVLLDGELFVSLQLLDDEIGGLPPKQNGVIAVIDTATDTVTGSIPLSFENPFGETKGLPYDEFQNRIYAGGPGDISVLDDGGIEAVDPVSRTSLGMVMTGADIGQNIFDFVIVGSRRAFAIVADNDSNSVVELAIGPKPADRRIEQVLLSSVFLITDIEMTERGELWVAYRGESPRFDPAGIRIFDVSAREGENEEATDGAIVLGQAPFTLAFVE